MPENPAPAQEGPGLGRRDSILGLQMADVAGLSLNEVVGNESAVKMMMHYYKQLVDENTSLKNDLNTLKTYVDGYNAKTTNATVGAVLQFLATIFVGIGINQLTATPATAGAWLILIAGVITQAFGLYFALRKGV